MPVPRQSDRLAVTEDDGKVLIAGQLLEPAEVTRIAARAFRWADGPTAQGMVRRYLDNYGPSSCHDLTTPSMAAWRALGAERYRRRGPHDE